MRARTAAVLLTSLVACSAKLEGAACSGDDNCPGGQKCGYDGKCSNAAAACGAPICRPGTEGCGSDGTIVPCVPAADGVCATFKTSGGQSCGLALTCGPGASCVDMFVVTLDAPARGTVVGTTGVAVQATVTLGSQAVTAPSTIKLLEGSTAKADLTLASQTGLQVHYQGNYVPGSAPRCSVALSAVAAYGTVDATSSPAVTVVLCVVTLDAPAPGTVVGPSGVAVQATVTLASSGVTAPSTVKLVEGSTAKADLTLASPQSGLQAHYQGNYSPGTTPDGSVTLEAVADYGTADEISSPVVTVVVDRTAPVISAATLVCAAPCLRDSVLTLSANVTDLHPGTVTAQVTFPAPVGPVPVTLTAAGTTYSGMLDVGSLSTFPFFSQSVSATFTATDQVGNASPSATTSPVTLTRRRWSIPVETASPPALTGPAVEAGSLFLGGNNGKVYKVDPVSGAIAKWPVAMAGIAAAPSVGATGLWVSGQDSKAYIVDKGNGTVINTACPTVGSTQTTAAVGQKGSDPETGYVGSQSATFSALYAVRLADCPRTNLYSSQSLLAAPAIDTGGNVYAAVGTNLHSYLLVNAGGWSFTDNWSTQPVVGAVSAPLAIDATPLIWTAAMDGSLKKTSTAGVIASGGTAGTAPDAPVLDAAGNIIVGDGSGVLHKLSPSGAALWASPPNLGAATASALVLSGGDAAYVVPTALGTVAAVKADGTVLWTGQVTAATGTALREPNILKVAGEVFSTAVFGAADGSVYGVIVDGDLDVSSPWPKAHHDTRNTGNASTPLP